MIDMKRTGMRCAAKKMIRSHEVTIQPANQGTIIYEVENLGRRLILVQWDGNSSTYAFPDEVDITGAIEEPQPFCEMTRERCVQSTNWRKQHSRQSRCLNS
jgi:hypothetical protein